MLTALPRRSTPDRWSVAAPTGAKLLVDLATCLVLVLAIAGLLLVLR